MAAKAGADFPGHQRCWQAGHRRRRRSGRRPPQLVAARRQRLAQQREPPRRGRSCWRRRRAAGRCSARPRPRPRQRRCRASANGAEGRGAGSASAGSGGGATSGRSPRERPKNPQSGLRRVQHHGEPVRPLQQPQQEWQRLRESVAPAESRRSGARCCSLCCPGASGWAVIATREGRGGGERSGANHPTEVGATSTPAKQRPGWQRAGRGAATACTDLVARGTCEARGGCRRKG